MLSGKERKVVRKFEFKKFKTVILFSLIENFFALFLFIFLKSTTISGVMALKFIEGVERVISKD